MEFRTKDAQAALKKCLQLVRDGQADHFRGQTRDWPKLIPSLFRTSGEDRTIALKELEYFKDWSRNVPQMAVYGGDETAITAIGQHYGIPTAFLDLTTNPEIALLFAKTSGNVEMSSEAVIYCFRETTLRSIKGARLRRINVDNLWRLEAQEGLFLECLNEGVIQTLREQAIRIFFPASPLSAKERIRLYPVRKSALEITIDQWVYRRKIERVTDSFEASEDVGHTFVTHRETYPGAFRWRKMPQFETSWFKHEAAWVLPPIESVSIVSDPAIITLPVVDFSDPEEARNELAAAVHDPILEHRSTGRLISFNASLSAEKSDLSGSVSTLINRCWDGLRVLPYQVDEVVASISLTATFLLARAEEVEGVDDWAERFLGELTTIEVAPIGGHIEAGSVASEDLQNALSMERLGNMTAHMRRMAEADAKFPMMYIVDPWMLFGFEAFKRLFAQQFIPTTVDAFWKEDLLLYEGALGCMWSSNFNPALLGFLTPFKFRFHSPIAGERDCSRIVYILPDMERADLEEVFISCMPTILAQSEPFRVRFHGYSSDPRPIWEIARAVEQSKWVVEVGGISVLDVMPSVTSEPDDEMESAFAAVGAFEIWLISKGLMQEVQGKSLEDIEPVLKEFWNELMISNANLETRALSAHDWPGATA